MDFNGFCGAAYKSRSRSANAQRCVNWFPEFDPSGGKGPTILYPTPGLSLLTTLDAPIRGMIAAGGSWLVVGGAKLYQLTTAYAATQLIELDTATGPVSLTQAGQQAMLVDGTAGYGVNLSAWTAARITDEDFPLSPLTCTAIDGYFITHSAGSDQWAISDPFDCFAWNGLDSAAAESRNDALRAVSADGRELFLVGDETVEVWTNVGASDFPFERVQGALIEHGTPASYSLARLPGVLFMLGGDRHGDRYAVAVEGYQSRRITTPAIEAEWRGYSTMEDARGWSYQQDGHAFYVVSFPTANKTWCFDMSTNAWHERPYVINGSEQAHRAICHAYLNSVHLVGDRENGNVYALNPDVYTDNGVEILRLRASPHVFDENRTIFAGVFEAFFESGVGLPSGQGSDPTAMLRISRDGGRTWGVTRTAGIGKVGEYRKRARWNRCGSGRDLVFELSATDPVKWVITGASLPRVSGDA